MRRHALFWLAASAAFLGNLFLHKPLSDVCDWTSERLGFPLYNRMALAAFCSLGVLAVGLAVWRAWRRGAAAPVVSIVLALGIMTAAAQRWLLVANIELIHLPQYGLLVVLLLAAGVTPSTAWLVATALGVADEGYQRLVIYVARPDVYLDYNDMVLNAIGAAWAVALLHPARMLAGTGVGAERNALRVAGERHSRRWRPAAFAAALLLLVWLDPPRVFPILRDPGSGRPYRILSAAEGLVVVQLLWLIVGLATRHRERETPTALESASGRD